VVSGFFDVTPPPYPVRVFEAPAEAQPWLLQAGAPVAALPDVASVLGDLHARARSLPPLVQKLRRLLEAQLTQPPTVRQAARALGASDRTLQRRLAEAGTTFQDEVAKCRIVAAKRLLADSDSPLTTIALDLGYASLQHFGASFRRIVGQSPSAWRRGRRALGKP
jgi:AraC-like DNA-binding protein